MPSRKNSASRFRLALISMPWAIFNRPSIQLGSLKAYVESEREWIKADALHPYLEIAAALGTERYHQISMDIWAGEALYAPLLFPERTEACDALIEKLRRPGQRKKIKTKNDRQILNNRLDSLVKDRDWTQYHAAGFSVCFSQLMASLTAAKRLKDRFPHLAIVMGGSSCCGDLGAALLRNFSQVDYVVTGEGEQPLTGLCEFLAGKNGSFPQGVLGRTQKADRVAAEKKIDKRTLSIASLDSLPLPDYRDYFAEMNRRFGPNSFIPSLPVEFSRGCWWGKCAFCNLNLQWSGYRTKSAGRMETEIKTLAERFGCLDFCFTDNGLHPIESELFFQSMGRTNVDWSFFAEIRVSKKTKEQGSLFADYRRGGMTTMQVGIEALSDSLLTRMNKGVSVLKNVATIKEALESRIILEGNLIVEFPGSTDEEVRETLEALEFLLPFHPLDTAAFFLGYDSPVDREPDRFQIRARLHHPHTKALLPARLLGSMTMLIMDYRGDRLEQRRRWQPVISQVKKWKEFHESRKKSIMAEPPLSFRDGGTFLIIRQERPDGPTLHHRLRGPSRLLYLYCRRIRSMAEIRDQFPTIKKEPLGAFLQEMGKKRLVFGRGDRYLSLAVRANKSCG